MSESLGEELLVTANHSRFIVFNDPGAAAIGNVPFPQPQAAPPKDPNDWLIYVADFRRVIGENNAIVQATVDPMLDGIVDTTTNITAIGWTSCFVLIRIAGGTVNTLPEIVINVILEDGELFGRSFLLPIYTLAPEIPPPSPMPPDNALTLNGVYLTVGGNYIPIVPGSSTTPISVLSLNGTYITVGGDFIPIAPPPT
jgi:hypothetical protein